MPSAGAFGASSAAVDLPALYRGWLDRLFWRQSTEIADETRRREITRQPMASTITIAGNE